MAINAQFWWVPNSLSCEDQFPVLYFLFCTSCSVLPVVNFRLYPAPVSHTCEVNGDSSGSWGVRSAEASLHLFA